MRTTSIVDAIDSSRQIWIAAFAVIAAAACLSLYTSWETYRGVDVSARQKVASDVKLVEAQMASLVRKTDSILDQVLLETNHAGVCDQQQIERLGRLFPEFRSISVIDRQGITRCANRAALIGRDQSAEDHVKQALASPRAGVLIMEKPVVSKLSEVPILVLHKDAVSATGQLRFIAQISIDLRYFDKFLESLREKDQAVWVAHDSGLLLSRQPDPDKYRLRDISRGYSAFDEHRRGKEQVSTHRDQRALDGTERFIAIAQVVPEAIDLAPHGKLLVGVAEAADDAYAGWWQQVMLRFAGWLLLAITIIFLADRVAKGRQRLQKEISHQKRILAELTKMTDLRSQERDALDEHAIVSMTDLSGKIVYANDRFCTISGYLEKELLGQNHNMVNSGTHPPEFFRDMWHTIAAGNPWHGLICNRAKGGNLYWVNSTIVPIKDGKGKLNNYISIRSDVTALVKAQESLRQSEEALRAAKDEAERARDAANDANRQKSAFLASMSHELRTPMNSILGFTQLLQLEDLSTGMMEDVNHIHKAGKHLLTLINEVLDLSRIESGRIELSIEIVNVGDLLGEVKDVISPLAQRKGITLLCNQADAALGVEADRSRLHQIILNLVSNAIKYNRPQGQVEVGAELRGDRVRISVADTGIGLSPSDMERLFTPYTRFGPRNVEGTGIGLTITKRLVEAMGGTIGVDSEVNVGSTFWVEFKQVVAVKPALTAIDGDSGNVHDSEAVALHGTVLYIEDNMDNQVVVSKALKHFTGLNLIMEADPHNGLRLAAEKLPDLILLDITLPQLSGFEVIERLRAEPRTRHIPVIALSANAMPEDMAKAKAAGFDDYLTKPVDIFSLRRVIKQYFQQKAA